MEGLEVGKKIVSFYKTGKYIGEIIELRPNGYLIKVLAVLKHPMQGDLHNPRAVEGVMFHERKALTYLEKATVPFSQSKLYEEEIPEFKQSLKDALTKMKEELSTNDTPFNQASLNNLKILEKDYQL